MNYIQYANSGQTPGKVLYQLEKIGVPYHVVSSVALGQNNVIILNSILFATFKWSEKDTPIFKFSSIYEDYANLEQPSYKVLMGLGQDGNYKEVGVFEDVDSLHFRETVRLYSKTYLADFDGQPLREQILHPTSFQDKINRLKNKFSK